ncbi:MAG: XRE family transcriptional regulator [Chloroflexota bacterium]|nr:XRE family transcriptional regulator [Chloroflexota bacterium]
MDATSAPASLINEAHRHAMQVPIREAATVLRDVLTPGVVAYLTGVDTTKTVARWASGETARLQEEHAMRLRVAFELVEILTQFDAAETVRNWFVGSNPQLDDAAPASVLREGRFGAVRAAALAFAAGG